MLVFAFVKHGGTLPCYIVMNKRCVRECLRTRACVLAYACVRVCVHVRVHTSAIMFVSFFCDQGLPTTPPTKTYIIR